jgi:predicted RecB family nuclease
MDQDTVPDAAGGASAPRPLSPTDISQYIRLDQCQRFLRLQLDIRQQGDRVLTDYDVARQTIPPILTRSGSRFEAQVEDDVRAHLPTTRFSAEQRQAAGVSSDNAAVVRLATALAPGAVHVLFQPRLEATVSGWRIRGDIDILHLEQDADGRLRCLITDMKSSTASKVEHRLQVAIYHEMLASVLGEAGITHAPIELAILYRGPVEGTTAAETADPEVQRQQRADAFATFATEHGFLERIADAASYLGSVRDLLTGPESVARRALESRFEAIPFHLTYKCDGCPFNEFCMKQSAEADDLSLLPHLTEQDKTNLRKCGVTTVDQVAALKTPDPADPATLRPASGQEKLCRQLAVTWPVGQHLDEVIHRAQRYVAWKHGQRGGISYIPHKGYGTLPAHDATLHPNLVKVYIDAQHDYLHDRIYMIGSLVVACVDGVEDPARRRSIVRMTPTAPDGNEIEKDLFLDWIGETLKAVVELAAPDVDGQPNAPIHLVFVNRFAQKQLLNGLGRYLDAILGATALYDFMTQMAAYDSPIASFLDQEIREQKNYPMVCQSLQAVASFLGFDWDRDVAYRDIFRARMFDFWRTFDEPTPGVRSWYAGRARFNSQIPLEYAYAAWGELEPEHDPDALAYFEMATREHMLGFQARRLEAMEHIAHDFRGNKQTTLSSFALPDLGTFEQRAPSLAHALDEFVSIERFVTLAAWKHDRLPPPEQRVLNGTSLVMRYVEADQEPGIAEQNRENQRREELRQRYRAEYRAAHPDAKQVRLPKEQKEESDWDHVGRRYKLRIETADAGCDLDEALNLSTIKPGARLVLYDRWSVDSRLPAAEQKKFTSTAKQLLYGARRARRDHGRARRFRPRNGGVRRCRDRGWRWGRQARVPLRILPVPAARPGPRLHARRGPEQHQRLLGDEGHRGAHRRRPEHPVQSPHRPANGEADRSLRQGGGRPAALHGGARGTP